MIFAGLAKIILVMFLEGFWVLGPGIREFLGKADLGSPYPPKDLLGTDDPRIESETSIPKHIAPAIYPKALKPKPKTLNS